MNYNELSNYRRHVVDCAQQLLQQSFDHADNLEFLEMCVSNIRQYALYSILKIKLFN